MSKAFDAAIAFLRTDEPKGILLDTNLFVVYIVALVDTKLVGTVKRTEGFRPRDGEFLLQLVPRFARRLITPGIWAEVSNLLEPFFRSRSPEVLEWLQRAIREEIGILEEYAVPAKDFADDAQLLKYGFTDLSIAHLAKEDILVLTSDLPLALLMQGRGLACVNYNLIRLAIT